MPSDNDQAQDPSVNAPESPSEAPGLGEDQARIIAEDVVKGSEDFIRELAKAEIEEAKPGKDPAHELDTNLVSDVRNQLTDLINGLTSEVSQRPKEGAEVTLAVRALQQARMWLGVAKATAEGHDPWAKDVKPEDK